MPKDEKHNNNTGMGNWAAKAHDICVKNSPNPSWCDITPKNSGVSAGDNGPSGSFPRGGRSGHNNNSTNKAKSGGTGGMWNTQNRSDNR